MGTKTALITGGFGYIGSHLAKKLKRDGWNVNIADFAKPSHTYYDKHFIVDIREMSSLDEVFFDNYDVVYHFAARIEVGLSQKKAVDFWSTNVAGTSNLLYKMKKYNIKNIVFASSAAVYGQQEYKLRENSKIEPNSVYGETKAVCEKMIKSSDFNYAILRFFNVAGADPEGELKENHPIKTHLIPLLIQNKDNFKVFGSSFNTKDGTCVRDYVHVDDVVDACILAEQFIQKGKSNTFNIGSSNDASVLEVLNLFQDITKQKVNYEITEARSGDPAKLVSNISYARAVLNWHPKYNLEQIINHATLDI